MSGNSSPKPPLAWFRRHQWVMVLILLAAAVFVLSRFDIGKQWLSPLYDPNVRLQAEIPGSQVMLRWNALVNPWRHPERDQTFQTELRLPLVLHNSGGGKAEVEALRVLSSREQEQIVWEGLWLAQDRQWDRSLPIEPQIQQSRSPLTPFEVAARDSATPRLVDFVPLEHPRPLARGIYHNRLQARLAGSERWVDLLRFDFTIPEAFKLQDSRGYRYQFWQSFPSESP